MKKVSDVLHMYQFTFVQVWDLNIFDTKVWYMV